MRTMTIALTITSLIGTGQPTVAQQRSGETLARCPNATGTHASPMVQLTLITETELKGRLVGRAEPDSYLLCDIRITRGRLSIPGGNEAPALITRSQIRSISSGRGLRFKTVDAIDSGLVRALVELNDRDRRIDVTTRDGRRLRGRVASINTADFTITNGDASNSLAYSDVTELRPTRLHPLWKVAIGIAIFYGIVIGISLVACGEGFCIGPLV